MSKKKILLIADVRNWAFDNIAQFLKPILERKYDVEILYTDDFASPKGLLVALSKYKKIDFIHFFYRGYLKILLEEISKSRDKGLSDILYNSAINTAVTDHLYLEKQSDILAFQHTIKFVDNYYATSSKLYDIYSSINYYPKPFKDVIFDNVEVKPIKPNLDSKKNLSVTWVGNSAWGEWCYGKDNDVKGFKSIIHPIMEQFDNIEFCIIDSQKKQYSKEEVFGILKKTDILLIASSSEATPLPLIEAMSQGCAIISTDVGIALEVLPKSQKSFIIAREKDEFVSKITQLDKDRKLLSNLKKDNLAAYEKIFRNEDFLFKKWSGLIEDSIAKSKNRADSKRVVLDSIRKEQKSSLASFKRFVLKVLKGKRLKGVVKSLLKFPPLNWIARQGIYFLNFLNEGSISNFEKSLIAYGNSIDKSNKEDRIIALYHSSYPGVANSTKTLFKHTITAPSYGFVDLIGLPNFIATKIAKAILASKVDKLIISGGSTSISQIIDKMYELEPNSKIDTYFLWHGSPAQWSEKFHLEYTGYSFDLYRKGRYKAVITLKKDLEKVLEAYNIKSYLLQNYVPDNSSIKPISNDKFTIGIWSAYALWVKNLYPQLMSLSMLKGDISCHTNFDTNNPGKWVCDVFNTKIYPPSMKHSDLLKAMSKTDLTLYVTNTECSPMIALESLSMGIPCLVGPTSGLYDKDPYLKEMLTVNRVDSPSDIAKAIERARNSISIIRAKIPAFIEEYNQEANVLKKAFIESIFAE